MKESLNRLLPLRAACKYFTMSEIAILQALKRRRLMYDLLVVATAVIPSFEGHAVQLFLSPVLA